MFDRSIEYFGEYEMVGLVIGYGSDNLLYNIVALTFQAYTYPIRGSKTLLLIILFIVMSNIIMNYLWVKKMVLLELKLIRSDNH